MPEGVGYGLGAMQQPNPMDQQISQLVQQGNMGEAGQVFAQILAEQGIDPRAPLVSTLSQYVATGGMDASEALRRLMR